MADCISKKKNLSICNCSYVSCERKGVCCECISYHRSNQELPACFFPAGAEKTYNRSMENFLKINK